MLREQAKEIIVNLGYEILCNTKNNLSKEEFSNLEQWTPPRIVEALAIEHFLVDGKLNGTKDEWDVIRKSIQSLRLDGTYWPSEPARPQ